MIQIKFEVGILGAKFGSYYLAKLRLIHPVVAQAAKENLVFCLFNRGIRCFALWCRFSTTAYNQQVIMVSGKVFYSMAGERVTI